MAVIGLLSVIGMGVAIGQEAAMGQVADAEVLKRLVELISFL